MTKATKNGAAKPDEVEVLAKQIREAIEEAEAEVREKVAKAVLVARELGKLDHKKDPRSVAICDALKYDTFTAPDYVVDSVRGIGATLWMLFHRRGKAA